MFEGQPIKSKREADDRLRGVFPVADVIRDDGHAHDREGVLAHVKSQSLMLKYL